MTGVDFICALLAADAAVVAIVPVEKIKAGGLKQRITLPAIVVTRVSRASTAQLNGRPTRYAERVQVTVMAPDWDTQSVVLEKVVAACDGKAGTIAGVANVATTSIGGGPDFRDEQASIWSGSEDFRVSYPA